MKLIHPRKDIRSTDLLSEKYCQNIDEASSIFYLDNKKESEDLFVFIPGLGLDAEDFKSFIQGFNKRCLAITLHGFHVSQKKAYKLTLKQHCSLIINFLEKQIDEIKPKEVIVVGFSIGADLSLQLIHELDEKKIIKLKIEQLFCLDPNLSEGTCFITKTFAHYLADDRLDNIDIMFDFLNRSYEAFEKNSTQERDFFAISEYIVKVFSKFEDRPHLNILLDLAQQISKKYLPNDYKHFLHLFNETSKKVNLKCVFSDNSFDELERLRETITNNSFDERIDKKNVGHFDLIQQNLLMNLF